MSQLREQLVSAAIQSYQAYYDVEECADRSFLQALCSYHARTSKYVLTQKAELWAAENHEYLYLWSLPTLDETALQDIFSKTLEDGLPRIKPHKEHMSTFLTAVVLCDEAEPQVLVQLKKLKKRQNYWLSLHGWMEFRIAAVTLQSGEIVANRPGQEVAQFLRQLTANVTKRKERRNVL